VIGLWLVFAIQKVIHDVRDEIAVCPSCAGKKKRKEKLVGSETTPYIKGKETHWPEKP